VRKIFFVVCFGSRFGCLTLQTADYRFVFYSIDQYNACSIRMWQSLDLDLAIFSSVPANVHLFTSCQRVMYYSIGKLCSSQATAFANCLDNVIHVNNSVY
jgi:hypothetical protein